MLRCHVDEFSEILCTKWQLISNRLFKWDLLCFRFALHYLFSRSRTSNLVGILGYDLGTTMPYCASSQSQLLYDAAGCLWGYYSCPPPVYTNPNPPLYYWTNPFPQWLNWQSRAATKDECLNTTYGRFGCRLPGANQILGIDFNVKWMYNEADCDCLGGIPEYVYTWTPGVWQTGTPRPLTWMTPSEVTTYEWQNATSFFLLESWVANSVEQDVIAQLKSQLVCEENVITNSLNTLVCDCLAADSPRGIVIYF
jgi:hypothetical protein